VLGGGYVGLEFERFGRSFALPEDADAEKVNAEFHDGVLKLHIATLPFKGRRLARHIVVPN